jgi:ribosomal protein S12 methylthiotransferase accessory factor
MRSNELLLFRGRARRSRPDSPLLVTPQLSTLAGVDGTLELTGRHADLVATALGLATIPRDLRELSGLLAERCRVESRLANELFKHLVEHELLLQVVPAAERVHVQGDPALSNALRLQMKSAVWPSKLPGLSVWCLGTLGSLSWRDALQAAKASAEPAFTWSLETDGGWLGPSIGRERAPCPACLNAWRTAVNPEVICYGEVVAHNPFALALQCQQLLALAERWVVGGTANDEVTFTSAGRTSTHQLLRQPGCPYCAQPQGVPAAASQLLLKSRFEVDFARGDGPEPPPAQQARFLDPKLGPLELNAYVAPGLFRDIPLALGSIRFLLPQGGAFERREMQSVTFGAGMTETRRRLVAFSEGIERYALSIDRPDIIAKRYSELGRAAVPPQETVRFADEQFSGRPGAPVPYEDQPLDWSWAYDWTAEEARLVLHDVLGSDRHASASTFRWIEDPFSSGAAAHRSLPLAMRRSLLELIEREALMLTWYLRLPLPPIDISHSTKPELREVYDFLTERGIELSCFDLRVDFDVPAVLLCGRASRDAGQWLAGGFVLSPSAAGSWDDAIGHALHEVLGHYTAFAQVAPDGDSSIDPATGEPHLWWANFATYFKPRQDEPLSFLAAGSPGPVPNTEPLGVDELLAKLHRDLKARDLPVLIRYLAPDAVSESGLIAVRACVPGLVRMTPSTETVNFGEPRFEQIRARWGAAPGLNPLPHPIC